MPKRVVCDEKSCGECGDVIARTYRGLRDKGCSDRDAFLASVNVLELRHPGHERYYYFRCVAQLLGAKRPHVQMDTRKPQLSGSPALPKCDLAET